MTQPIIPQNVEVLPAEQTPEARATMLDACRDTFAAAIAQGYTAKHGLPEAGGETNISDRIYAFANSLLDARTRLEVAEAKELEAQRARAISGRPTVGQHASGVRR